MTEPILFYGQKNAYRELSNFYPVQITYKGFIFPTTEHAFQWAKFYHEGASEESKNYATKIRLANSPSESKKLGQYRGIIINPVWEDVKDSVMKELLLIKFSTDKKCKDILLSTSNRSLVEHTPRDKYWGDGGNGTGLNRLGKLLEKVRAELLINS